MPYPENNFTTTVRGALEGLKSGHDKLTREAYARIGDADEAHREWQAFLREKAVDVLQDTKEASKLLELHQEMNQSQVLAESARVALRGLAERASVFTPIGTNLRAYVGGLKAIQEAENEILSLRASHPPRVVESFRWDILEGQRANCLRTIDRMVDQLKALGWEPSQKDYGVIGGERKRLQNPTLVRTPDSPAAKLYSARVA